MDIFTREYNSNVGTVRAARNDIADLFGDHPDHDDILLVASELTANAAEHGTGTTYTVTATRTPQGLRVTITNQGGTEWPPLKQDAWRTRGRGRWIVQDLAPAWGGQQDNTETVVWFTFPEAADQRVLAAA